MPNNFISNRQLNISSAGQIALNLDKQDGTQDGTISKDIWTQFWEKNDADGKFKGRNEAEVGDGGISVRDAMKAIMTRIFNAARASKENPNAIGDTWLNGMENVEKIDANTIEALKSEQEAHDAPTVTDADGAEAAEEAAPSDGAAAQQPKAPQKKKYSTSDIKVTVPKQKYMSKDAKAVYENQKSGKAQQDNLKRGKTDGLTEENVAYAMNSADILFGPNTKKQAEVVFKLLVRRMIVLGICDTNKDCKLWENVDYSKINALLRDYRNRIIRFEKSKVEKEQKRKDEFNKNPEKIQASFDKANQVLVDAANNPSKVKEILTVEDGSKLARLQNGAWIYIEYKKGEISRILISHTVSQNTRSDGSTHDSAEITYSKVCASVDTDESNDKFDTYIESGYDFEKLKEIAEAIFGKSQPEE